MPRLILASIAAVVLLSSPWSEGALRQGIRMSPDFLPLDVGNVWRYEIADAGGNRLDEFSMEIRQHTIVEGRSLYIFSQFPLRPRIDDPSRPLGVRYDRDRRQYVMFDGEFEDDLFPSLGASAEVVETDSNGLPRRAVFDFGPLALTLERGVGIIAAEFRGPEGAQSVRLVGARVGAEVIGDLTQAQQRAVEAPRAPGSGAGPGYDPNANVTTISEANPMLEVAATPESGGHRLSFRIRNTSDKLLPFDFSTSQSVDFVVVDPSHGQEIWRWSRRMFFSQVMRSEAIRAGGEWSFEAVWNYHDDDLNRVEPGTYQVYAILTASSPIETDPIEIEVP